jgi:hypothetical protein
MILLEKTPATHLALDLYVYVFHNAYTPNLINFYKAA